jgi:hypothetical protein
MARGRWRRRRAVSVLLFVGAASAALAAGGPDALVPFSDVAGAAATVGVGFVIDFGGSGASVTGCVEVPPSDNGYQALSAFVAQENLSAPGFAPNGSGLLCSINGIPAAPACGQAVTGGYQYWSYWYMTDGSGNWSYASRGASATVGSAANGQDVEGWRFQNPGPDNPSAPKPSVTPDYASLCHSVPAPTTTVPTPATAVPPPVTTPTSPVSSPAAKGAVATTPSTAVGSGASPGSTSPSSSTTAPVGAGTVGSTTTTTPSGATSQSLRAADTADHEGSGGGGVPALIGALVVLALAVAAVVGWRRRARTP